MIKLTKCSGENEYVSPEHITHVNEDVTTRVHLAHSGYIMVTESPEEVTRKILEYKLEMVGYQTYMQAWTVETRKDWKDDHFSGMEWTKDKLKALAGLEETP